MSGPVEAISPSSIRSVRPVRGSALPVWQVASTADLLVVGPATFDADPPPAPVLTTRQRVLAASQRAGISLIDPIRQGWLQEQHVAWWVRTACTPSRPATDASPTASCPDARADAPDGQGLGDHRWRVTRPVKKPRDGACVAGSGS